MDTLATILVPPANGPSFCNNPASEFFSSLPDDFRQFMQKYGAGLINDSIQIYQPDHPAVGWNMQSNVESEIAAMRNLNEQFPDLYAFKKYPDNDGFLPWARSSDGESFFGWLTTGHADDWPVATIDDDGFITNHKIPFAEFLLKLCTNKLANAVDLPNDFFDGGVEYDSIGG